MPIFMKSISGIKITQSFAREDEKFPNFFNEVSEEYRQSFMKAVRVQYLLWPAVQKYIRHYDLFLSIS